MWKWFIQKSRPRLSGKVAALAVGRGKCEQKRKNKKISMSKTNKKYSDLCTPARPYRLARLGTSLRVRGKLTLRKKAIKFYKSINWSNEYTKNRIGNASRFCMFYIKGKRAKCKPSPNTGTVAALAVGRGKCEQIWKIVSYRTVLNTACHSWTKWRIWQRIQVLNTFFRLSYAGFFAKS